MIPDTSEYASNMWAVGGGQERGGVTTALIRNIKQQEKLKSVP